MAKQPPFMDQRGADPSAAMKGDFKQGKPSKKTPKRKATRGQFSLPKGGKRGT